MYESCANVFLIPLDKVVPDPKQPRENFPQASINELARSMITEGQLDSIKVHPANGDGTHIILDGERRYRAANVNGWKEIKAEIVSNKTTAAEIFKAQIVHNVVRDNMSIMERVHAYNRAIHEHGVSITDLAKSFGVTVSTIEADLPLANLPKELQRDVDQKEMSKEIGRKLATLHDDGFSDAKIKAAWKDIRRAPSVEGQSKRLEVWKTVQDGENTALDNAKEDTDIADRRKYGKAVSQLLTGIGKFSKREDFVSTPEIFMQGAMMHLTKEIKSGQFKVDLNHCYKVLDEIKAGLTTYEAHK